MPVWWNLDQALFWVATRDKAYVEAADARPRQSRRTEPLTWVGAILSIENHLPIGFRVLPEQAADDLLQELREGSVKAKFNHGSPAFVEPDWFNGVTIDFEERGDDAVARVRWVSRDPRPEDTPAQAYLVIRAEDMRQAFPITPAEIETPPDPFSPPDAPDNIGRMGTASENEATQPVPRSSKISEVDTTGALPARRRRGRPSYKEQDTILHLKMDEIRLKGPSITYTAAAELVVDQAEGANNRESAIKRLTRGYGVWLKSRIKFPPN